MAKLLHPKATAVWLVDNTTLTFKQIAEFTGMHELEVQGIADGDVAAGVKGFDPVANNQLEQREVDQGEKSPAYRLKLKPNPAARDEEKRRGPRYTPLSKRKDRPAAILWLVKFHPELTDGQIGKLVGTTKPTILSIRDRTHWDIANTQPIDPVALGLCKQSELDAAIQKASKAKGEVMDDDERRKLVSTEQSLGMDTEPRLPSSIEGLQTFSLSDPRDSAGEEPAGGARRARGREDYADADSFFNLPDADETDDEDEDDQSDDPRR